MPEINFSFLFVLLFLKSDLGGCLADIADA